MFDTRDEDAMEELTAKWWSAFNSCYFRPVRPEDAERVNAFVNEPADEPTLFYDRQSVEAAKNILAPKYREADAGRYRLLMKHYYLTVHYYLPLMQRDASLNLSKTEKWLRKKYSDSPHEEQTVDSLLKSCFDAVGGKVKDRPRFDVCRSLKLLPESGAVGSGERKLMCAYLYNSIYSLELKQIAESVKYLGRQVSDAEGRAYFEAYFDDSLFKEVVLLEREYVDLLNRYRKAPVPAKQALKFACHHCTALCDPGEVFICGNTFAQEAADELSTVRKLLVGIRASLYGCCNRAYCRECLSTIYKRLCCADSLSCAFCGGQCCCNRCSRSNSITMMSSLFEQLGGDISLLLHNSPISSLAVRIVSLFDSKPAKLQRDGAKCQKLLSIVSHIYAREVIKLKLLRTEISAFNATM